MKEKMKQLIQENLVIRVGARVPGDKKPVPDIDVPSRSTSLPDIDMPLLATKLGQNDNSVKDLSDKAILWQVSRIGVTQLLRSKKIYIIIYCLIKNLLNFRDEMFAEALTARIDCHAGNLVRCLLQLMTDSGDAFEETSSIFHKPTIHSIVKMNYPGSPLEQNITEYLQVLGS